METKKFFIFLFFSLTNCIIITNVVQFDKEILDILPDRYRGNYTHIVFNDSINILSENYTVIVEYANDSKQIISSYADIYGMVRLCYKNEPYERAFDVRFFNMIGDMGMESCCPCMTNIYYDINYCEYIGINLTDAGTIIRYHIYPDQFTSHIARNYPDRYNDIAYIDGPSPILITCSDTLPIQLLGIDGEILKNLSGPNTGCKLIDYDDVKGVLFALFSNQYGDSIEIINLAGITISNDTVAKNISAMSYYKGKLLVGVGTILYEYIFNETSDSAGEYLTGSNINITNGNLNVYKSIISIHNISITGNVTLDNNINCQIYNGCLIFENSSQIFVNNVNNLKTIELCKVSCVIGNPQIIVNTSNNCATSSGTLKHGLSGLLIDIQNINICGQLSIEIIIIIICVGVAVLLVVIFLIISVSVPKLRNKIYPYRKLLKSNKVKSNV